MLLTTLMFTVINLMSSVSREALVCFMCVICGLVIKTIRKKIFCRVYCNSNYFN